MSYLCLHQNNDPESFFRLQVDNILIWIGFASTWKYILGKKIFIFHIDLTYRLLLLFKTLPPSSEAFFTNPAELGT